MKRTVVLLFHGATDRRRNSERGRGCKRRKEEGNGEEQWWATGDNAQKRDKAERKRTRRGREKEAGWRSPLEHPQSTSPERCINISHTHKTNGLAHSLRSHRRESEAERKC